MFEEFCVEKERFTNVETIVMGDFNCDFMGKCNSSLYKYFKELITFNWFQLIDSPTRATDSSSSCIDLIFSSDKNKISQSGAIPIGISDHFMTYCTRNVKNNRATQRNKLVSSRKGLVSFPWALCGCH